MRTNPVLDQLSELQEERDRLLHEVHSLQHQYRHANQAQQRLTGRLQMSSALNLSLFTAPDVPAMYQLLCKGLVFQLHWDMALVVGLHGRQLAVYADHGLTEGQLQHLRDYLPTNAAFANLYHSGEARATAQRSEPADLALRSLFASDELVLAPIQFGAERYAYVVVGSHSHRGAQYRSPEELDFLVSTATLVAHAVQYNLSFKNLEDQNRRLRQLDQIKDSFLSIASHQLRTPLSIIKWVLAALRTDPQIVPLQEQSHLIAQAYDTNERLIHVVTELLNVSRIQEGRLQCTLRPGDLREIVLDIVEANRTMCENQRIELRTDIAGSVPILQLDPLLMKESIQNLVSNAIDYNLDEGGFVAISLQHQVDELVVSVTNTGVGVEPEDREKVFTQFFRGENAMRCEPNGNGLGLYLARVIVEEHGGRVEFVSHPGKETTFTIRIPVTA